ncbi:6-carboxyhexanoate--CoA ligase [Bacillus inaquosorum]|nr:6-carboxyhexanoate--CoA ligase [Bacillus inaquosorum]
MTYNGLQEAMNAYYIKASRTPDFMQIQLESVNEPIKTIRPLTIAVHQTATVEKGQTKGQAVVIDGVYTVQ